MAICAYFYFINDNIIYRNLTVSIGICLITLFIAREFIRKYPKGKHVLYYVAGAINAFFGVSILTRALFWVIFPFQSLFSIDIFNSIHFMLVMIYEVGWGLVFFMMNNQRMEMDLLASQESLQQSIDRLEKAISEVKTLSGLLPICASCKKIRDDKGYWNQIEIYIRNHSNAEFSHGICPDCAKKLYPELIK